MIIPELDRRLSVCSWSLQPKSPQALLEQLKEIGIPRLQCALDPIRENPEVWGQAGALCQAAGVTIDSGMFGTHGEDYTTLESIRRTGGLVPDDTWDRNWDAIQETAELAEGLGLTLVTFHAGFLPHEESDPGYAKLMGRMGQVADAFAARGIDLGCETGQETADTLLVFLNKLNRPNVGVNFDPANMILYDKGDPIEALKILRPWLKQCHIKDALRTRVPGTWGEEVVAGAGEVDWSAFFKVLLDTNYQGGFAIEREAGDCRVKDIRAARDYVVSLNSGDTAL